MNTMSERCRHFGRCGGCQHQDLDYDQQRVQKASTLASLFGSYWKAPIEVEPSPVLWHYRNKVDFTFGGKHYDMPPPKDFQRETVLGFKQKGRWYAPLEIDECKIGPEGIPALLDSVRDWVRLHHYPAYDTRRHSGLLKALLVREGKRTDQRMVALITREGEVDVESFVEAVRCVYPADSIYHAVSDSLAEGAFADRSTLLYGDEYIYEELQVPTGNAEHSLRFRLSPFSFFQTNTLATERLYARLREWVHDCSASLLYDLYGGSGGIGLVCADFVPEIVSVESVRAASEDGESNAAANGVAAMTFITQPVEDYLRDLKQTCATMPRDAVVVLDPPRAGLHPKALRRLTELRPRHIVYVACKPQVLANVELPAFREAGYRLCRLAAVDLFPHTQHVEVLAHLTIE